LGLKTTGYAQHGQLFICFYAFGDRRHIQIMRQVDYRTNDCSAIASINHSRHERPIYLDFVEREHRQVGKGGIPRSKIVKNNLNSDIFEATKYL